MADKIIYTKSKCRIRIKTNDIVEKRKWRKNRYTVILLQVATCLRWCTEVVGNKKWHVKWKCCHCHWWLLLFANNWCQSVIYTEHVVCRFVNDEIVPVYLCSANGKIESKEKSGKRKINIAMENNNERRAPRTRQRRRKNEMRNWKSKQTVPNGEPFTFVSMRSCSRCLPSTVIIEISHFFHFNRIIYTFNLFFSSIPQEIASFIEKVNIRRSHTLEPKN